jgi:hypothetical protein
VFNTYKDLQKAGKLEFILATSSMQSNNRDSAKLPVTIDLLIDFKTLHNTQDVWNALEKSATGYAYLHLVWDEKLDPRYDEDELKIPHISTKSQKPKAKALPTSARKFKLKREADLETPTKVSMYALCYALLISKQVPRDVETLDLSRTSDEEGDSDNENGEPVELKQPPLAKSTCLHTKKGWKIG